MGKDHTKYYNYIIEDVDEKTIFHTTTNVYGVRDTWFSFNFGEERYHTIQYNGGQGICNMFKLYNPMRRLHTYLIEHHGLKYDELENIIKALQKKWGEKYSLTFINDEVLMRIVDLERKCEKQ